MMMEEEKSPKEGDYYRHNEIYRHVMNKRNGNLLFKEPVITNHSKVLYDASFIPEASIVKSMDEYIE